MDKKKTEILREKYAGSFDGKKRYKPFSTRNQFVHWGSKNCGSCKKGFMDKPDKNPFRCDWERALCLAAVQDCMITEEVAQAIGFLDSEGSDIWECPGWKRRGN